ncbi:MAG: Smr/MutS family protein [Candidatus Krumholzibacteria bacterium]|nr:Smr/MutS family protein [Candidatus Krumholzibacteria bacterium]
MSAIFSNGDAVLPLPVGGERQIRRIVPKFLASCRANQIYEVRIVHGTSNGRAQKALHAVLKDLPEVACFRTGGPQAGSAKATIVVLVEAGE